MMISRELDSEDSTEPMRATVILTVSAAGSRGRTYVFDQPASCVAGRAPDCDLRIGTGQASVSRHHCAFEIDPPHVLVQDLDSSNGTYVNGAALEPSGEQILQHGDVVRLGRTVVQISVEE
jgi:pSer/pThr/pTyr-binding forkhead associated (FHA) protein